MKVDHEETFSETRRKLGHSKVTLEGLRITARFRNLLRNVTVTFYKNLFRGRLHFAAEARSISNYTNTQPAFPKR